MADGRRWTAQINDLIGGWVVTDYPHPLSEHDFRLDGDTTKCSTDIIECRSLARANQIARLLNEDEARG